MIEELGFGIGFGRGTTGEMCTQCNGYSQACKTWFYCTSFFNRL